MKVFCATTNAGKLREFRGAASRFGAVDLEFELLPALAELPPCEETGSSFEENAVQKAVHYSRYAPGLVFADDSGLEVAALDGAPGVRSARFAGPDSTDEANNRLLLERLDGVAERRARFVCVIALAEHGQVVATFRGAVEGIILDAPRGGGGFGYDPLFFHEPFGCTFGEATAGQKLEISHRGRALRAMLEYFRDRGKANRNNERLSW